MLVAIRGIGRFFIFFFVTLAYLTPILVRAAIKGNDLSHALELRRRWANFCCSLVGVRIDVNEPPAMEGPCLYMGNHRSYFDPVAVLRDVKALPVAKAEISGWPFIGFAARSSGVMYVKRENRDSRRATVLAIEETLKDGFSVLVYPEASTHMDATCREFRPGAFRLAAEMGVAIVPIAIEYSRPEDAWVGTDTFIPHFLSVFGQHRIYVKMRYGQPIRDADPERLSARVREWIDDQVAAMRPGFYKTGTPPAPKTGDRATS
jgi:lyso-ornithine lipid O-acyltransferase